MLKSYWDSNVGNTAESANGYDGEKNVVQTEVVTVPDIDSDEEYVPRCVWFSKMPFGKTNDWIDLLERQQGH